MRHCSQEHELCELNELMAENVLVNPDLGKSLRFALFCGLKA